MNYHHSLRHLFNKVVIPNIQNNNNNKKYEKDKTLPNKTKRPYSSYNTMESKTKKGRYKNLKLRNFSANLNSKRNKSKRISYKTLKKGATSNFLHYNSDLEFCTNTTQTPTINHKSKMLLNSFRSKNPNMSLKNRKIKIQKKYYSSYLKTYNNKVKINNDKFYLDNSIKKNNICIGANIDKTINNVVVDNNIDLLREYNHQTVNNFNNKYKLKFKAKAPKIHNKIYTIFSLLKKYKYEEEKKMDTIKTLVNEKPKKIKKRKKKYEIFNQKEFEKNVSLIENDFDLKNKLKDDKKFVYIHTLNLLKKQ